MEINLLNWKDPGVFAPYIPRRLVTGNGVVQGLAFHDQGVAQGAAVVEVGEDAVDILSLRSSAPPGVCERALTEFLAERAAGTALREIVYIAEGTEEELEALDRRMLVLGYVSQPGEGEPMEARLGEVLEGDAARQMMAGARGKPVYRLGDIPEAAVRQYNRAHPDNPIRPGDLDVETSRFYLLDNRIQAVMLTAPGGEGRLSVEWLSNESGQVKPLAYVLGSALEGARDAWPAETVLVLYGDEQSGALAKRLGFQPAVNAPRAHVYTYYLDGQAQ